ncbi:hypothetical protein V490_01338 [Pseudogymnoascus sp. VKM F-3557]|nr:hypothetical protein V490_01338 [Pseudogymnoascus sp. VKM F-3557]
MDNDKQSSTGDGPKAAQLRVEGNQAMKRREYDRAISLYTSALFHSQGAGAAVLLANRAAAYHSKNEYGLAKADAQAAVTADPHYIKGWSRLGLAEYILGNYAASAVAYRTSVENGGSDLAREGYKQAKVTLGRLTAHSDMDPFTSLADLIVSTSTQETTNKRIEGRTFAAEHNGKMETLLKKLENPHQNIHAIEQDMILPQTAMVKAAAQVVAFKGKVIALTHIGNSIYTTPSVRRADLGELLCERRFIPKDFLSRSLQACYPSGYDTVVLAIFNSSAENHPCTRYLMPSDEEGSYELMIVVLDEGQTTLPSNPQWYRGGRHRIVSSISNAELIERLDAVHAKFPVLEMVLLPGINRDGELLEKSVVQLKERPLITRSQLARRIEDRLNLCNRLGFPPFHISGLENYLNAVNDETQSWTRERVLRVSEDFARG